MDTGHAISHDRLLEPLGRGAAREVRRLRSARWLLALLLVPAWAQAQDRFASVEVKATHVAGTIFALEGAGGNIGASVGEDGILLVDDQYAPLAAKIRTALAELGQGNVVFVLNTHHHGDHVGGNPEFGTEATIVAHANVRERVLAPAEGRDPMPATGLPVMTFEDSLSIHFNGEEVRAIHLPHGHTDGDLVVLFTKSNVAHLGDLFFHPRFPRVDLEGGGTVRGYVENVGYLVRRLPEDVKIIPGHGAAVATRADLARYHEMLVQTVEAVRHAMQAGKSLETMQSEKVLAAWEEWSWNFIPSERWIETIHRELSGS